MAAVAALVSVVVEEVTAGLTVVAAVVVDVSTDAVSDLVEVLQPLKAKPARRSVNKTEFFIGGLSCLSTDRALPVRFRPLGNWFRAAERKRRAALRESPHGNGLP